MIHCLIIFKLSENKTVFEFIPTTFFTILIQHFSNQLAVWMLKRVSNELRLDDWLKYAKYMLLHKKYLKI